MAHDGKPLPADVLVFVASLPAAVLASCRPARGGGGYVASVDYGPSGNAGDPPATQYADSRDAACEKVKAWILDDLSCCGHLGQREYQPHWTAFDVRYRLGVYWREKAKKAGMASQPDNGTGTTQSDLTDDSG